MERDREKWQSIFNLNRCYSMQYCMSAVLLINFHCVIGFTSIFLCDFWPENDNINRYTTTCAIDWFKCNVTKSTMSYYHINFLIFYILRWLLFFSCCLILKDILFFCVFLAILMYFEFQVQGVPSKNKNELVMCRFNRRQFKFYIACSDNTL